MPVGVKFGANVLLCVASLHKNTHLSTGPT
jgi:hypothetical protein